MPAANKHAFQLILDNQRSPQYFHVCYFVRYKYVQSVQFFLIAQQY
jgi:hypothetical protein